MLHSTRLTLRKIKLSDMPDLLRHVNHPQIADNIFNIGYPYTEEDAVARIHFVWNGWARNERWVFAIIWNETGELIGEIGIHPDKANNRAEMGYWIGEKYWGKGIATEAIGMALKFGFEKQGLHKIFATHFLGNPASGKAMERNGMILEAEMKDHYLWEGEYRSVRQYRLTEEEYRRGRTQSPD